MFRQAGRTFDATTYAPTAARHFVEECLRSWGLAPETERIVLAVSELVTNAVTHGRGPVGLTLDANDVRVRVDIEDEGGGGTPVLPPPDPQHRGAGGWGLRLVDTLADDWGIDTHGHRTTVWFEHRLP